METEFWHHLKPLVQALMLMGFVVLIVGLSLYLSKKAFKRLLK